MISILQEVRKTLYHRHDIQIGREALRQIMITGGLWRARRQKVDAVHQWRERRTCRGELIQWDTSTHDWLEGRGEKIYLIHMIDDATSELTARFVRHDSTEENMSVLGFYLERHGRPGQDIQSECDSERGGNPAGDQRLHVSLPGKDLQDRACGCAPGSSRQQRADRGAGRRLGSCALLGTLAGYRGVPHSATPTTAGPHQVGSQAKTVSTQRSLATGYLSNFPGRWNTGSNKNQHQSRAHRSVDAAKLCSRGLRLNVEPLDSRFPPFPVIPSHYFRRLEICSDRRGDSVRMVGYPYKGRVLHNVDWILRVARHPTLSLTI